MASLSHDEKTMKSSNANVMDQGNLTRLESNKVGQTFDLAEVAGTHRNIKSRHAQMIAIGGSIGTGFFIGSGQALAIGGPGLLFIAYTLVSILVFGVVTAIVEIAAYLPLSGTSTAQFGSRYVSKSLGFALGWLYFYSFGIIAAYEIVAATIVIGYWPNSVHPAVWITLMAVVIIALNVCPVGVYAETEFWFAGTKIIMTIGLLLLALIITCGGGPQGDAIGFRYWNNGGAVKEYLVAGAGGRFTSFLYIWVFSGFSFYFGPENIVYTTGEMRNPRKNLPTAARHYFVRLAVFYIFGSLAIGLICDPNSDGLTSGAGNANASPWVIAIKNAGISALPSIINAGIIVSAWSAGNAFLFMSTRSLYSLALVGSAPKVFARCNRYGLPYYAVIVSSLWCCLAYLSVGSQAGKVFNWFISLTNTAGFTSWLMCCIIYLRFRKACDVQGVTVPYRSKIQPYAAWICIYVFAFLLLMNGFTVFYPGQFTAAGFITTYLGIPIFAILWVGHKFIAAPKEPWFLKPEDVDLHTGLAEVEADARMWNEMEALKSEKNNSIGGKVWSKISLIWN